MRVFNHEWSRGGGGDSESMRRNSMKKLLLVFTFIFVPFLLATAQEPDPQNGPLEVTPLGETNFERTGALSHGQSTLPSNFKSLAAPGETQDIVITANLSGVPEGEWRFGHLFLTEDSAQAPDTHMPVAAAFSPGSLPETVDIVTRRNAGSQLVTG
jgi:hypothetical protein